MFRERIGSLPAILNDFVPGAPFHDRATWGRVSQSLRQKVIRDAEEALERPWPLIRASDYCDFTQSGNRSRYEDLYFSRRRMLNHLVLGELLEGKGRFLPSVIDGIFLIVEESGWQVPAHNAYERGGPRFSLPDTSQPVIDLFAAETAALLSTVVGLMRDELDAVSPQITARIEREIQTRIFSPYLGRHFWWMGRGDERMNNWTAWITQNVLLSAFCLRSNQALRRNILEKALGSLDAFLKDYAEDGACEEGVVYYRHAALCLSGAMTILDSVAPGVFSSLWSERKIRNMAEYILNMHVSGRCYFNFGDSSAIVEPCSQREILFGKAVGSQALTAFAAADRAGAEKPHLPVECSLWYRVQELLAEPLPVEMPPPSPPKDIFYPGIGLFVARDQQFSLAVKGGHNGESHNHNDVGSLTLYKNGRPFLIDVGVETYTAKTFSSRRYEIWTMQSAFHNLPTFAGVMQSAGESFAAKAIEPAFGEAEARFAVEIAGAYPPAARVRSYKRVVSLVRGSHVEVSDVFDGDLPAVLSLMMCIEPSCSVGQIVLPGLGHIELQGAGEIAIDPINVEDERLRSSWPGRIYRVRIVFAESNLKLRIF